MARDRYLDVYADSVRSNPNVTDVAVRTDADGDEIRGGDAGHAFVALDVTLTNETGVPEELTFYVETWQVPERDCFLGMIYLTPRSAYDDETPAREALVQGIGFPH